MDVNWRPTQGSDPAAGSSGGGVDPNALSEGDWRAQLLPEGRSRIVNKLMETMKNHLPVSLLGPVGLNELQKIAAQFEEKIYAIADNQSDYLRKISLRMLSMEMHTQQDPGKAQVIPNQNNPVSMDSTAQTSHAHAGDWREEIYQVIKRLKDQHFLELSKLFDRISVKLQRVDNIIPPQKPSAFYEKMKRFKITLDHLLQVLLISKSSIQPAMRHKVHQYEKQIIDISKKSRAAREKLQPRAGQAPGSNILRKREPFPILSSMSTGSQYSSAAGIQHACTSPPTTNFSVPAERNGANIQRQAGSNIEAAGSNFSSMQYGSMGSVLQLGSTGPMQGTIIIQKQMQGGGRTSQDRGNTSPCHTRLTWVGDTRPSDSVLETDSDCFAIVS